MRTAAIVTLAVILTTPPVLAQQDSPDGNVQIPLDAYNELMEGAREDETTPVPAPASFTLGQSSVRATVSGDAGRAVADVRADLTVEVFAQEWVLVPLLSAGTAVNNAMVDGKAMQLVPSAAGLCWSTDKPGVHKIMLSYSVDASPSPGGMFLALPVPAAASTTFSATLPGTGYDVAVIPAAGVQTQASEEKTVVEATVPRSAGIHLSWRFPSQQGHAVSRAAYRGRLKGQAVVWVGEIGVELFSDETVTLELLPASVTLSDVAVDGRPGTILADDEGFKTLVKGRGRHTVRMGFEVPVAEADGLPSLELQFPRIPVSSFELTLPGKKEVTVTPSAGVVHRTAGANTVATAHVPLTDKVSLSWSEAVPEASEAELRAKANVYHTVHAEEGVLYGRAMLVYEVTRGETNQLLVEVPAGAVVNDVRADNGGVAEWTTSPAAPGKPYRLNVFLDRQVDGEFVFDVLYEKKLGTGEQATEEITVPVLRAMDVNRQRGMVALLASKEFTLKPVQEAEITRVGENQLPAFVREAVEMTIAHTYKYVETSPTLTVQPAIPERREGKFDAQVDTLISLSDVTMNGAVSVDVNVKSGGIMELALGLPAGVNVLSLSGPSLRTYKVVDGADEQVIDVQFTQEMEGQFRLEVAYEYIMGAGESDVTVPSLTVQGVEVEQGRIGVEALTAVEVQASRMDQLSSMDPSELPQQLILRTTNPILLAYKYVRTDAPFSLGLTITRHQEIDVQEATIDTAEYRTLYTRDGLAVTTARYTVRNCRKQFLKVELPRDSEVWSVFVDGKAEKPALIGEAGEGEGEAAVTRDAREVLIKIINSSSGFPVEIIYATEVSTIGALGRVRGRLPRPDMVVTNTRWDVFLPADVAFGSARSNMDLVDGGTAVTAEEMRASAASSQTDATKSGPLRIQVPTSGVRYSFSKLYANRSDDHAAFALPYSSAGGALFARLIGLLGTAAIWLGVFLAIRRYPLVWPGVGACAGGALLLMLTVGLFGTGLALPIVVSLTVAAGFGVKVLVRYLALRREFKVEPESVPSAAE